MSSEKLSVAIHQQQAGNVELAEKLYTEILAAEPQNALIWNLLGTLALQIGQHDLAVQRLSRALELKPDFVAAHTNLGVVLRLQGQLDGAIDCYRRAIQLLPSYAEAHFNMGNALKELQRLDEAIICYRRALAINPHYVEALGNLGCALRDSGDMDGAFEMHARAVEARPHDPQAHFNVGSDYHAVGNWERAAICYQQAIKLKPDYAEPHVNHSAIRLLHEDFAGGWDEYEWRWKSIQTTERIFAQRPWKGESLAGKTILLYAEQGFGDTFQFIRYALLVKQLGATVIVECPSRLIRLLSSCPGIDRLIPAGEPLPAFNVHAAFLSLPRILQTKIDTIPANVPYLFAQSDLVSTWRDKLSSVTGLCIGINWHGRQGKGDFLKRDIPLEEFAPLAALPDVRLIGLQKNDQQEKRSTELQRTLNLVDLGDDVDTTSGAFMDTAAIMKNLDLILTSDTSTAHLAGALGVPVWVALPHVADWRWLLHRDDSPWYPTMRLFRQKKPGDWAGVFTELSQEIRQLIANCDKSSVRR